MRRNLYKIDFTDLTSATTCSNRKTEWKNFWIIRCGNMRSENYGAYNVFKRECFRFVCNCSDLSIKPDPSSELVQYELNNTPQLCLLGTRHERTNWFYYHAPEENDMTPQVPFNNERFFSEQDAINEAIRKVQSNIDKEQNYINKMKNRLAQTNE